MIRFEKTISLRRLRSAVIIVCLFIGLSRAQVNTERFRQDSEKLGLTGNLDISGTWITGNVDLQLMSLGGRLNHNRGESYTFLVWDGGIGWNEGKSILNQALAHLRNVSEITGFIQNEIFLQYDMNRKRLLLARQLAGAGIRFKVLTTQVWKVRIGGSVMVEYERYELPADAVHRNPVMACRASLYSTLNLSLNKTARLASVVYFQPWIGRWNDCKVTSENVLAVTLSPHFDWNMLFDCRYDSRPPDGIKNRDTVVRFGFSFKF